MTWPVPHACAQPYHWAVVAMDSCFTLGVCVSLSYSLSYLIYWHTDQHKCWSAVPVHAMGELPCGSQPTAPTCVVWSWHLKEYYCTYPGSKGPRMIHCFVHSWVRWLCHANEPQQVRNSLLLTVILGKLQTLLSTTWSKCFKQFVILRFRSFYLYWYKCLQCLFSFNCICGGGGGGRWGVYLTKLYVLRIQVERLMTSVISFIIMVDWLRCEANCEALLGGHDIVLSGKRRVVLSICMSWRLKSR